jgi:FkbM family methyltransferase
MPEGTRTVEIPLSQTRKVEHKEPAVADATKAMGTIRTAEWGYGGVWRDVTAAVARFAASNDFAVTNANLGCDPCPGVRKQMVLTLADGQRKVFLEGETCDIKAVECPKNTDSPDGRIDMSGCLDELRKQNPVMYQEFFERNCLGVLPKHVEGRRIVDVGANYGFFGLQARSLGSLSVLAIEPDEHNFSVLTRNSVGRDITPMRCAVMQHGVRRIRLIDSRGISKSLPDAGGSVEARTLHEVLAWMPPEDDDMVLKIDVEGGEYDILLGASGRDLRRFAYVFVDTHQVPHLENRQGRTAAFLEEYLGMLGFEMEKRQDLFNWGEGKYEAIPNQHSWLLRRK